MARDDRNAIPVGAFWRKFLLLFVLVLVLVLVLPSDGDVESPQVDDGDATSAERNKVVETFMVVKDGL